MLGGREADSASQPRSYSPVLRLLTPTRMTQRSKRVTPRAVRGLHLAVHQHVGVSIFLLVVGAILILYGLGYHAGVRLSSSTPASP